MKNKPVKLGYKLWVAATLLGFAIQFYPYIGKDDFFDPATDTVRLNNVKSAPLKPVKEMEKPERASADVAN